MRGKAFELVRDVKRYKLGAVRLDSMQFVSMDCSSLSGALFNRTGWCGQNSGCILVPLVWGQVFHCDSGFWDK